MASRLVSFGALVLTFGFAVVAIIFSLLGVTSHEWAVRDYYDSAVPEDWVKPDLIVHRGLFSLCTASANTNTTTDDQDITTTTITGYTQTCYTYRPYGEGRTSCELPSVLKSTLHINDTYHNNSATRGDARLCQQIHYAGNFGISGALFVSLASLMTAGLAFSAFLAHGSSQSQQHSFTASAEEGTKTLASEHVSGPENRSGARQNRRALRTIIMYSNITTITFFIMGAILLLIAQAYGILAFIQSSPNNADFASSTYGTSAAEEPNAVGFHGPWYQGKGLSVFTTCGWAFALVTAAMAAKIWPTPRWTLIY